MAGTRPNFIEGAGGTPQAPGSALEGSYYTNHSSMDNPDPTIQNFVGKYKTGGSALSRTLSRPWHMTPSAILAAAIKTCWQARPMVTTPQPAYRAKVRDAHRIHAGVQRRDRQHHNQQRPKRRQACRSFCKSKATIKGLKSRA